MRKQKLLNKQFSGTLAKKERIACKQISRMLVNNEARIACKQISRMFANNEARKPAVQ